MTGGLVKLKSEDGTLYHTWTYDLNVSPPGRRGIKGCLEYLFISKEQYRSNINTHLLLPLELV